MIIDDRESQEAFEAIMAAIRDTGRQLQLMVDAIAAMQDIMPMLTGGWGQFECDIEYTNEKHGLNLTA